MSEIETSRTARWVKLRRRVIIAGLLLGTLNTIFAYVNILGLRSRGALQVLTDQQAGYSQPTIRYGRQCGAYVIENFEGEKLKQLWDFDNPGFDLTYPTDPRSQKSFDICFTDLAWDSPAAVYYLRRQIQGYLNVHEIAYSALVDKQCSKL